MNADSLTLQDMHPHTTRGRRILGDFLTRHDLRYEDDTEYAVGAYDEDDTLLACGCVSGAVLKGFAVAGEARGRNVLGSLLSHLIRWQFQRGVSHLLVFTKPDNKVFFQQSGFYVVAETQQATLLENLPDGPARFARERLRPEDVERPSGALVANCNPFTLGHRHLVEYAAARCAVLHIFLVEEDRSAFPFAVRKRLLEEGTADIPNVRVHGSGLYIISAATFPTYFIKELAQAEEIGAELDLTLFARHIVPLFSVKARFVGEEPHCALTRRYNELMARILQENAVELHVIPRLTAGGSTVSASRVRALLREQTPPWLALRELVPESTRRYLESEEAAPVLARLRATG